MAATLRSGRPWVYRDHVPRSFSAPSGSWVRVQAGDAHAWALWSAESAIALRVFSQREQPSAEWVRQQVRAAVALRKLAVPADTNAFRLLFGEGDGLPGVTADVYASHLVIASYAVGLDEVVRWVADAILEELSLESVVHRRHDQAAAEDEMLRGRSLPEDVVVEENGVRFYVNLARGQKTGLYLDQRDNRAFVAQYAAGRSVLNLFSYTGAFSVYAAHAGARRVTTVDVSAGVVEAAQENFRLNGLDPGAHEFIVADAFDWVDSARQANSEFELVVCDPPSLARRKEQRAQAQKAYRKLNTAAFRLVRLEGFLATASCTAQVDPTSFSRSVAEAAARARRRFQILRDAGHAADHPLMAHHPEGRYLKFLMGRVLKTA